jgi:D-glycero-alpha-D-manno-heptose 1-phosphate guanylyltransferase
MITEAIILAGGFGTRLKSVVQDLPKPMAPICGKPFLVYLLIQLQKQGIQKVILSVGYKHEKIAEYFGKEYLGMKILYAIEHEPLGTGGGIALALELCENEQVVILNGDTFFDVDIAEMEKCHQKNQADLSIAIKKMQKFDRYGTIEYNESQKLTAFLEKEYKEEGYINAGVYLIRKDFLKELNLPQKFSFEKEVMEAHYKDGRFFVYEKSGDNYFIDIGIPEDYAKAEIDFTNFR